VAQASLDAPTTEQRPAAPAPKAGSRARFNKAMRLVRRAHLYAGLFMTPWVFLYGVTAMLFNHPEAFPDQEIRPVVPADLAGTPLADFPPAESLAGRVVAALNEDAEGPDYRLVRPEEAAYNRDYTAQLASADRQHTVRIDLASRSGSVRSAPARKEPAREAPAPFAGPGKLRLDPPLAGVGESLPRVLDRLGLPAAGLTTPASPGLEPRPEPRGGMRPSAGPGGEAEGTRGPGGRRPSGAEPESRRRQEAPSGPGTAESRGQAVPAGRGGAPELTFLMEGEGTTWRVGYNLQTGALTGRREAQRAGEPLSWRRFLLRLHTAHGYPGREDARWVWALAVDAMSLSMVGWGITGLLMWWQMKNVRRTGLVLLALSALVSAAVAVGMHGALTSGIGR
jgi:hypothetical protein